MQTHDDFDFNPLEHGFMERLKERAEKTVRAGESQITGGKPDEPELAKWKAQNGMNVVQRPNDEQGIQRISVGGVLHDDGSLYAVFRGDRAKCAHLLERAAHALREGPPRLIREPMDGDTLSAANGEAP